MTWRGAIVGALAIAVVAGVPSDPARGFASDSVWFIDPDANAVRQQAQWRAQGRAADADTLRLLAESSQADWFGGWSGPIRTAVAQRLRQIESVGAVPVFVAYNVPGRDCSSYSAGGATGDEHRVWIDEFASGIGDRRAVVILEPDSLALTECLSAGQADERYVLIAEAVTRLVEQPGIAVYLDGGHSAWHTAPDQAGRLLRANLGAAQGVFPERVELPAYRC